jgi:hypothetical protein
MLAARLGATIGETVTVEETGLTAFQMLLPRDFPLNVPSCLLIFPDHDKHSSDILSVSRRLSELGSITLVFCDDRVQFRDITAKPRFFADRLIVLHSNDIGRLFVLPRPLDYLRTLIVSRVTLSRVSPYQINEGIRHDAIFFGRDAELNHILKREPANYIIIGARQLGKTSLLRAVERRMKEYGNIEVRYIDVGYRPILSALAQEFDLPGDADLANILRMMRSVSKGKIWFILLDEVDHFIEDEIKASPKFQTLDAMRSLSSEGRCFFIIAGFWKLFEVIRDDYFVPLRNFGETMILGPLDVNACLELLREPMATLGISYADTDIAHRIVFETGQRPNLIQIVCTEIIRRLSNRRTIELPDVEVALGSSAVTLALDVWGGLTADPRSARIDRIIVWAMLEDDEFDIQMVFERILHAGASVQIDEVTSAVRRLELAFILWDRGSAYRWRVPLFRERRRREVPEQQLAEHLQALAEGR